MICWRQPSNTCRAFRPEWPLPNRRYVRGKLVGAAQICVAVGKVINHDKVARHFELLIADDSFTFKRAASHCCP